jgi:hypothetical protein
VFFFYFSIHTEILPTYEHILCGSNEDKAFSCLLTIRRKLLYWGKHNTSDEETWKLEARCSCTGLYHPPAAFHCALASTVCHIHLAKTTSSSRRDSGAGLQQGNDAFTI